ncbi:hypothetical protein [Cohnella sp. GCM10012308]|uniref:hypothetical protein n=1 Tax=Cohnella sp. GCM10012308 TaxID=3317329 RepID=UPI003607A2B2
MKKSIRKLATAAVAVAALSQSAVAAQASAYTFFQTGQDYRTNLHLPVDAAAPYLISNKEPYENAITNYGNAGYEKMAMISFTHDFDNRYVGGFYDGSTHYDIVQKDAAGNLKQHLGTHSYVTPTAGWNNYVRDQAVKAIGKGATTIILEEPEIFGDAGYEDAFKAEWLAYYGTAWADPAGSAANFLKASKLRNYLLQREINAVLGHIKTNYPAVKTYIAAHSQLSYFQWKNPYAGQEGLANAGVDGIVGQAWSNTMEGGVLYEGSSVSLPFENGYLDYSYFAQLGRANPGKDVALIIDPKGDGYAAKSWDWLADMNAHQLAAAVSQPNAYRFEIPIWPERIMGIDENEAPDGFKTAMANEITVLNDMHNYTSAIATSNRPLKAGILISDTTNWQAGGPGNTANQDSVYSLAMPLLHRGFLIDGVPLEGITAAANPLSQYDVVYVSYDLMKPQSSAYNIKLRDYVNGGGIVVYFGGRTPYENTPNQWWNSGGSSYASPQDHLLSLFGIGATGRTAGTLSSATLSAEAGSALAAGIGSLPSTSGIGYIGYTGGSFTPMYKQGTTTIAFEKSYGTGKFVYFGIDPYYFGNSASGSSKMFNIMQNIGSVYKSASVSVQNAIAYTRGPYKGIYSISGTAVETGKYIDVLDPDLQVVTTRKVAQGKSALLKDVSGIAVTTIPRVLFAQGNNPAVSESASSTVVTAKGASNSLGAIRILSKDGLVPQLATAVNGSGRSTLYSQEWDDESKSALIKYWNAPSGVTVTVNWSAAGAPAKLQTKYADDRDAAVTYSGAWNNWDGDKLDHAATEKFNYTAGGYAQFSFTGSQIRVIGKYGGNQGKADFYVDGALQASDVDLYAPDALYRQVLFAKTGLTDAAHTVKVIVKGTKNVAATNTNVVIDRFEYGTSLATKLDDRHASVAYTGGWGQWSDASDYAGTETFGSAGGNGAQLTFTGTAVRVISNFGSNQGRANIYVDGKLVRTVDLYSAVKKYQQIIYSTADLAPGSHNVKVEVDRTKNAAASDYNVVIDAFEYG